MWPEHRSIRGVLKKGIIAKGAFCESLKSLVLAGIGVPVFAWCTLGQSLVSSDVKRDTLGPLIRPGQSVHVDVELSMEDKVESDVLTGQPPQTHQDLLPQEGSAFGRHPFSERSKPHSFDQAAGYSKQRFEHTPPCMGLMEPK